MDYLQNLNRSVHLNDYLRVINKHSSLVFLAIIVCILLTILFNQIWPPVYQAQTRLLVEEKLQDVNLTRNMLLPYQKEFLETQRQILESDPVFEATVQELGLAEKKKKVSWIDPVKQRIKALLGLNYSMTEEQKKRNAIEKSIRDLRKQVSIEGVRGTNIIHVYVEGKDPQEATEVANSLASQFIQRSLFLKNKDSFEAAQFLKGQLKKVQKGLVEAESKLEDFQFTQEAISLDKRIEFLVEKQIVVAEKDYEDVVIEMEQERERVEILHAQVTKERAKKSSGEKGTYKLLTEQQLMLELKLNELKRKFTPQHPEVAALIKSLDLLKQRIAQEEKVNQSGEQRSTNEFLQSLEKDFSDSQRKYRILVVKEEQLRIQLQSYREKLQNLLKKKSEFLVLKRELDASEKLYELLLKKEKEVGVESRLNVGHVKQVQEATLPVYPVRPKKLTNLVLSVFLGFFLGTAFAFLREYMDQTLKFKDEITARMPDSPLLGTFHQDPFLKKERHLLPTIAATNPNSAIGESFKILKANLDLFLERGERSFLISSSLPSEGKSTTATNLAITFARAGKKVVLMDCDLRKPKLHQFFELGEAVDSVYSTQIGNLHLWKAPSDRIPDPTIYLESRDFHQVLEKLKQEFDLVLVDSAPLTLVSDTSSLLRQGLPVVLVVGAGVVNEEQLLRAKEILQGLEARLLGFVISRLEAEEMPGEYKAYYEGYFS